MELISLILQVTGIIIIFINQLKFWIEARKEYKGIKRAFLDFAMMRFGVDVEKLSEDEVREYYKKFPLANWLYKNYRNSIVGALFTLIGVILRSISLLIN
jgi:hypothetical protein